MDDDNRMDAIRDMLNREVEAGLAACIGCHECVRACPVADDTVRIADLNLATRRGGPMPARIERFAVECFQCGACVPVCPAGLERDAMMLQLKARLGHMPACYVDDLKHKGGHQPVRRQVEITVHNLMRRPRLKGLAGHVDKRDLKRTDTMFFFGCNIFSETGVAQKVLALADYLRLDYEVLGGLRSCCGWAHYLAGDLERAETLMGELHERIVKAGPKEVVTICAECYTALRRMAAAHGGGYTPVTCTTWIRQNLHRFPIQRLPEPFTFHDACHVTRKLGEGEEARRVLRQVGSFVEMERHGDAAPCCGRYQFDANPTQLEAIRRERIDMARRAGASRMVVECVRCLESYAPVGEAMGVEVTDIVDLVYDAIRQEPGSAAQPVHFGSPIAQGRKGPVPAEGA
jgi:Fe-S oxidoreductase